jgi:hypothetical protein
MKGRQFIALLGGAAAAWPLAARAQQAGRVRRIGVLLNMTENDPQWPVRLAAFQEGLLALGWIENRNYFNYFERGIFRVRVAGQQDQLTRKPCGDRRRMANGTADGGWSKIRKPAALYPPASSRR